MLTSKTAVKKFSIKLGKDLGLYQSAAATLEKQKDTLEEHRAAKKIASELQKTFQEDLMVQKAIDHQVPLELLQKMLIWEERARQEGRESRQIYGRNNKCPVLNAEVTDFVTRITIIVQEQEEIVAAATEGTV